MEIDYEGIKGRVKDLPKVTHGEQSVMKLEATVEGPTKQDLRKIRPFTSASLRIPKELGNEATTVLRCLFDCFDRQKAVQVGLFSDLVWGFQQSNHAPALTIKGLEDLEKNGYLFFMYKDNSKARISDSNIMNAYVVYEDKLLDMVYEPLDEK